MLSKVESDSLTWCPNRFLTLHCYANGYSHQYVALYRRFVRAAQAANEVVFSLILYLLPHSLLVFCSHRHSDFISSPFIQGRSSSLVSIYNIAIRELIKMHFKSFTPAGKISHVPIEVIVQIAHLQGIFLCFLHFTNKGRWLNWSCQFRMVSYSYFWSFPITRYRRCSWSAWPVIWLNYPY